MKLKVVVMLPISRINKEHKKKWRKKMKYEKSSNKNSFGSIEEDQIFSRLEEHSAFDIAFLVTKLYKW